jgi:photosystem II stability/assembly factor-like uncharacterized protein
LNLATRVLLAALLLSCSVALAVWESTGPEGGRIRHVVQSPTDGDLFATTGSNPTRVLKSTDDGSNWSTVGSFSGYDYCLTAGPDGTLWAAGGSVYESTDDGVTWTSHSTGMTIYSLAVHPTDPNTLYGCGYDYVGSTWQMTFAKSTNGGSTWTLECLIPTQSFGRCVAVSASNPSIVYAGGYSGTSSPYDPRLFKSTDGGATFSEVVSSAWSGDYYMNSLAIHPTNSDIVLACSQYAIFRTTNGGTSWVEEASYYRALGTNFSLVNPNVVFAGGTSTVYRSLDAGASWTSTAPGLDGNYFESVPIDYSTSSQVYTGGTLGFWRSTDTGGNWSLHTSGLNIGDVLAMQPAPSLPSRIYLSILDQDLYMSTDAGANWSTLPTPLSCGDVCAFAVHPTNSNMVLALEGTG